MIFITAALVLGFGVSTVHDSCLAIGKRPGQAPGTGKDSQDSREDAGLKTGKEMEG